MTDNTDARLVGLEVGLKNHLDICSERYQDIRQDTAEIKQAISTLAAQLSQSVTRIHERADTQERGLASTKITALIGILGVAASALTYSLTHWGPFK